MLHSEIEFIKVIAWPYGITGMYLPGLSTSDIMALMEKLRYQE